MYFTIELWPIFFSPTTQETSFTVSLQCMCSTIVIKLPWVQAVYL